MVWCDPNPPALASKGLLDLKLLADIRRQKKTEHGAWLPQSGTDGCHGLGLSYSGPSEENQ